MRLLGLAVVAAAAGACAGSSGPAPEATYGALEGAVARVGDTTLSTPLVTDVSRARGEPPADALRTLVEDALAAQGARARGLEQAADVRWASTAALARQVPRRFWAEARAAGAPTDDELAQVEVVHAVVMRTHSMTEARALFMARAVADAVATARTTDEFEARAKAATSGVRASVETLAAFDASGRMLDGQQLDPDFTAAAFALHTPGETSPVVETSFGWHVIRLMSRVRPAAAELETRRLELAEAVTALRARGRLAELVGDRRQRTRVEVSEAADELMAQVASGR